MYQWLYANFVYDDDKRYIICLESRTCSCGRFPLDEISCQHTIVVLKRKNVDDIKLYCSDYYKPETLVKTYDVLMFSTHDKKDLPIPKDIQE